MGPRQPQPFAVAVLIGCVALAACGGDGGVSGTASAAPSRPATLVLDYVPGPVHAGVYAADAAGYYADAGIDLEIVEPTSTADTLKLIDAGKADFGLADGIDVATQIDQGRDAQAIMAIAQRPLGGVIALRDGGVRRPRDLQGRTVGLTGVPSDRAVLDAIVAADGGDPGEVDAVTIGFNGVAALEAGKVDGFTGFIPADGVQVETDGYPTRSFAPDRWGGLVYPGLVAFSTVDEIASDPELMQGFVTATVRGYEDVLAEPEASLGALLDANPAIPAGFARKSLEAYLPYLQAPGRPVGSFDRAGLAGLSDFLLASDLIDEPISPDRYAAGALAGFGG